MKILTKLTGEKGNYSYQVSMAMFLFWVQVCPEQLMFDRLHGINAECRSASPRQVCGDHVQHSPVTRYQNWFRHLLFSYFKFLFSIFNSWKKSLHFIPRTHGCLIHNAATRDTDVNHQFSVPGLTFQAKSGEGRVTANTGDVHRLIMIQLLLRNRGPLKCK